MKLYLYVPTPGSPLSRYLLPGSAIVSAESKEKKDSLVVYFEGNKYGAVNLNTFSEKARCAAGRLLTGYPTVAKMEVGVDELMCVGTYDYDQKMLFIERGNLIEPWEKGTGVYDGELQNPASLRFVLDVDLELNGTPESEIRAIIEENIRHMIGNGGLTGHTDAETDCWSISVL